MINKFFQEKKYKELELILLKDYNRKFLYYDKNFHIWHTLQTSNNFFLIKSEAWLEEESIKYLTIEIWNYINNPFDVNSKEWIDEEKLRKTEIYKKSQLEIKNANTLLNLFTLSFILTKKYYNKVSNTYAVTFLNENYMFFLNPKRKDYLLTQTGKLYFFKSKKLNTEIESLKKFKREFLIENNLKIDYFNIYENSFFFNFNLANFLKLNFFNEMFEEKKMYKMSFTKLKIDFYYYLDYFLNKNFFFDDKQFVFDLKKDEYLLKKLKSKLIKEIDYLFLYNENIYSILDNFKTEVDLNKKDDIIFKEYDTIIIMLNKLKILLNKNYFANNILFLKQNIDLVKNEFLFFVSENEIKNDLFYGKIIFENLKKVFFFKNFKINKDNFFNSDFLFNFEKEISLIKNNRGINIEKIFSLLKIEFNTSLEAIKKKIKYIGTNKLLKIYFFIFKNKLFFNNLLIKNKKNYFYEEIGVKNKILKTNFYYLNFSNKDNYLKEIYKREYKMFLLKFNELKKTDLKFIEIFKKNDGSFSFKNENTYFNKYSLFFKICLNLKEKIKIIKKINNEKL